MTLSSKLALLSGFLLFTNMVSLIVAVRYEELFMTECRAELDAARVVIEEYQMQSLQPLMQSAELRLCRDELSACRREEGDEN
jgi:hypothetical protein